MEGDVEAPPQLPLTDGRYFACRRCRRILSEAQWLSSGCIECSATMGIPERDSLLDFATPHFHNFVGLIAPGQSWVARLIMKSRAETNGIFAETLSDDESEGDEEEEEEVEKGVEADEDEDGEAVDAVDRLSNNVMADRKVAPAPTMSSAPLEEARVAEADCAARGGIGNDDGDDVEGLLRDVKRVKVESGPGASGEAPDGGRNVPYA